jgi:aminobenzoyl-glutamate utilization protein B
VTFHVEFHGKAAHAARDPWTGRSALDGVEVFTHALNMMREHITPTSRMHYVISDGGKVPNVVPDFASLYVWLRDSKRTGVDDLLQRVEKIAEGAALATGTESKVLIEGGSYEMLPNKTGERVLYSNLMALGPLAFTQEEQEYAKKIQQVSNVPQKGLQEKVVPFVDNPGEPSGGSTDVADVSWVVPTIHLTVTTAPVDAPWHAWPVVACSGMSIGHKGMIYASKALATTMVDLFENPQTRDEIKKEFAEQTKGHVYKSYAPEGPPPLPKDDVQQTTK